MPCYATSRCATLRPSCGCGGGCGMDLGAQEPWRLERGWAKQLRVVVRAERPQGRQASCEHRRGRSNESLDERAPRLININIKQSAF
mmetsp:Transcript_148804/g.476552  ORF Transcript_148804/g.476552 Transcript_148804/m.476552 type:complete len:87 (-) Transcript_148804:41-301(-)